MKKNITSFYGEDELSELGLAGYGTNVLISRRASVYTPEKIVIGSNVRIDDFCILSGSIKLGNYIHIAAYCGLFGGEKITFGDFVGLSSRVSVYTISEDYLGNGLTNPTIPDKYRHPIKGKVSLQDHVIIGAGTVILPGVVLGKGSAVGALSLVSTDVEPWNIYVGVPAKFIKKRKKDMILRYQSELGGDTGSANSYK